MRDQIRSLAAAIAGISMTACGGSDTTSPVRSGPQIPKAQLAQQADAICREDAKQLTAKLSKIPRPRRSAADRLGLIAPYLELRDDSAGRDVTKTVALGRQP